MKRTTNVMALEEIREQLKVAGLRTTGPRVAVLRHLTSRVAPASHAELVDALSVHGYDRATIYRNLKDLARVGIVTRADLGDHVWRYELRNTPEPHEGQHPHFTCTNCGMVSCLKGVRAKMQVSGEAPQSVRDGVFVVRLRGLCDRCGGSKQANS